MTTANDGTRSRRSNPLRELSEQEVLEAIFDAGPITRPQIAQRTALSKATVGTVVERLERAGMIRTAGPLHGHRGRSPLAYEVCDNAGFVVGVDIGGTNVRVASADIFGVIIWDAEEPTTAGGARAISAQVVDLAAAAVERGRLSHGRLLACAVSTPGVVDAASRRVTSLAYNVSPDGGLDPRSALRARFDVPVTVENNVNLAALGEARRGRAQGVGTFVFISIGAGVGLGLVVDGKLVRGAHGAAGEIGYLPISADPFDERHRLHGGLEDEIGAAGIVAAFAAARAPDDVSATAASERGAPSAVSAQDVFALARQGDRAAASVVDGVARRLASAIASVVAVIDPELVVIGGGIGSNDGLLEPVCRAVEELVPLSARIVASSAGARAALYGAIALALREARAELFGSAVMPAGR